MYVCYMKEKLHGVSPPSGGVRLGAGKSQQNVFVKPRSNNENYSLGTKQYHAKELPSKESRPSHQ